MSFHSQLLFALATLRLLEGFRVKSSIVEVGPGRPKGGGPYCEKIWADGVMGDDAFSDGFSATTQCRDRQRENWWGCGCLPFRMVSPDFNKDCTKENLEKCSGCYSENPKWTTKWVVFNGNPRCLIQKAPMFRNIPEDRVQKGVDTNGKPRQLDTASQYSAVMHFNNGTTECEGDVCSDMCKNEVLDFAFDEQCRDNSVGGIPFCHCTPVRQSWCASKSKEWQCTWADNRCDCVKIETYTRIKEAMIRETEERNVFIALKASGWGAFFRELAEWNDE